jgi:hypothetical protein
LNSRAKPDDYIGFIGDKLFDIFSAGKLYYTDIKNVILIKRGFKFGF